MMGVARADAIRLGERNSATELQEDGPSQAVRRVLIRFRGGPVSVISCVGKRSRQAKSRRRGLFRFAAGKAQEMQAQSHGLAGSYTVHHPIYPYGQGLIAACLNSIASPLRRCSASGGLQQRHREGRPDCFRGQRALGLLGVFLPNCATPHDLPGDEPDVKEKDSRQPVRRNRSPQPLLNLVQADGRSPGVFSLLDAV